MIYFEKDIVTLMTITHPVTGYIQLAPLSFEIDLASNLFA